MKCWNFAEDCEVIQMTTSEAIFKLIKYRRRLEEDSTIDAEPFDMAIEALKLTSKGHWIIFPPFIEEICMCSNCKTKFKEAYQHRDTCPSCGARMK